MSKTSHLLSKQNSQQPKQFRGGEKKVMKKSLSLLVAIAMVFSMFATLVSAAEKTAGEKLEAYGIIKGTSEGLSEDAEWKRQDVTVLISRLLGVEAKAAATANTHGFTDVDSKFYNGYISWAKAEGYFLGETATVFGVGNSITNQEFAAVLLRVLGLKDVPYAEAFEKAVELKLVSADLVKTDKAIRGNIYTALVTALDYEIDGKKLGTILGLEGYKVVDVAISSAKSTNSKTVVVEYNQEIADVIANDFTVLGPDDSLQVIESVATSGKTATITLTESLKQEKTYTVTSTGVISKDKAQTQAKDQTAEFTYVKTAPVSVEVTKTVVAHDSVVPYAIKDAAGNDIAVDVLANDDYIVTAVSSAHDVIGVDSTDTELKSKNEDGYSVVNVTVVIDEDKTIESGNTVVKVQPTVNIVNGVSELTLGDLGKDAVLSIFAGESGVFATKVVDTAGNTVVPTEKTFKSANPSILVVDTNEGTVQAVKAGSATVTYTAKYNDKTVTKSVVITVKAEAKLTSIEVSKSSVKLVDTAGIAETVKVTLKDQYGDKMKNYDDKNLEITVKNGDVVTINDEAVAKGAVETITDLTSGEVSLVIAENANDAASEVITVKVGTFKKTISASVVKKAALAGYIAEISAEKIDKNAGNGDKALDDATATVKVYEKDTNGNKIGIVTDFDLELSKGEFIEFADAAEHTVKVIKAGKEVITVKVKGVKVASFNVEAVNTASTLTKYTQAKNALSLKNTANLSHELFGYVNADGDVVKGAFVGYDQYGTVVDLTGADISVYSANKNIIDGKTVNEVDFTTDAGTVLLTVVIEGNVFTISVKVSK
ncbi:Ig-like domain-containing protein [Paenibacillus endoradicis]|uniref:Ig-like domain-containing protein n=1 Tax=Paenibacillus endoradicis TaxID=2972487 RepID=UPI0021592D7C|nr:hypothetical protein [Paenibacillus endoradicis]MCR8660487.1 hypothetical protein [Paenibacillus endoradicis]